MVQDFVHPQYGDVSVLALGWFRGNQPENHHISGRLKKTHPHGDVLFHTSLFGED